MPAYSYLRYCVAGAFLLQACTTPPAADQLAVHPTMKVTHSTNETAEAYYQLGRVHQGQGNLDLALSGYTYAIARDPRHMEARNAAAAIHAQQGRLDQARAMMLAVIADYPTASQAHNNLGYIDHLRGDHASAARGIRQALALDPANARARNNLQLVEAAMAAPAPTSGMNVAAAEILASAVALATTAPEPAPKMELVQVVPNVYELKNTPKVEAPVLLAAIAPLALPASRKPLGPMRLDVANGDGTPGLARRVGAMFGQHGYPVARLSNERPFGQRNTRIEYRPGYGQQADALRKLIEGPVQMTPVQSLAASADLRVVLGKDTGRAMARRERAINFQIATR